MKRLATLAVCLAAALTLPASAEESLDEIRARVNVRPEAWEGFEPGSYIDTKTTTTVGDKTVVIEERVTLTKRDKDGTRIERCRLERSKGPDGKEVIELGTPSAMVYPVKSPWEFKDLKEVRKEDVVVGGKTISCRVIRATYAFDLGAPVPGQKGNILTFPAIFWWNSIAECWNGIVKLESEQPKDQIPTISINARMVDIGREVRIGNRRILCDAYACKSIWQGEKEMHDVESLACARIPGRAVLTVEHGKNDASRNGLLKTVTTEVTAFEAKGHWLDEAMDLPAPAPGASPTPGKADSIENALRILADRARRRRLVPDPDAGKGLNHPELSDALALLASRDTAQSCTDRQARIAAALAVDLLSDGLVLEDLSPGDGPITLVSNVCPPILDALTGASLGSIPRRGGEKPAGAEAEMAEEEARTIKRWKRWWEKAGSAQRDQWAALASEAKNEVDAESKPR